MTRLHIRFSFCVVVGFIVFLSVIDGVFSALIKTPRNVIIEKGDDVYMECSTDAFAGVNTITWEHDGVDVTRLTCTSIDTSRFNISRSTPNDCFLVGHANSISGNQGPYHCSDGSGLTAEAVAVLIDPKPSCSVVTSPPIRGENVTLSCVMNYNRLGDQSRLNPGADMSASISWESAAGTVTSSSSTDLPYDVEETLQADVVQIPTGTEIPSYNCTSWFTFSDKPSEKFKYALNSLSWTCISEPVLTWYCPSSVTVNPSSGPFKPGDVLTCASDGYPGPSYTWTDSDGVLVSNARRITLSEGPFNLTCTATGNFTTPCTASSTVSGNASVGTVGPRAEDGEPVVFWLSFGIGVLLLICIFILLICCCFSCCPLYCKSCKEDSTDISQPTGDISKEPSTRYEPPDVNRKRPASYRPLPPEPGHDHHCYNDASSVNTNTDATYLELDTDTHRPPVYEELSTAC